MSTDSAYCLNPRAWAWYACVDQTSLRVPLRCRNCPGCDTNRRDITIARISAGLTPGQPSAFLTLTSLPATPWWRIMQAWTRLVAWLRKNNPHLQYALVKEQGPATGMKHLHAIVAPWHYIPWLKLSAQWRTLLGAWVVNVQRILGNGPTAYIAKYIAKGLANVKKHATFSRGWKKAPHPKNELRFLGLGYHPPTNAPTHVTPSGMLIYAPNGLCPCFPDARPLPTEEWEWLKSIWAR